MKKVILLMIMIGIVLVGCVKKEPSSKSGLRESEKLLNFEEVPTAVNTLVFAETYTCSSKSCFAFTFRQVLEKPCIVYSPKVSYYDNEINTSSLLYCPLLLADEINDGDNEAIKFTAIWVKENIYELKHLEVAGFVFDF